MTESAHFLDRMLLLIKEELIDGIDDATILDIVGDANVVIVADEYNAASHSAQTAIVTAALLIARCGLNVWIDVPSAQLVGPQPPLISGTLTAGFEIFTSEHSSSLSIRIGRPAKCSVSLAVGSSEHRSEADLTLAMNCGRWTGILGSSSPWPHLNEPFGAMVAATMASAEIFKFTMQRLRRFCRAPDLFDQTFNLSKNYKISLAHESTAISRDLGKLDIVSGGAVTNAFMFALLRIPGIAGDIRVVEPQTYDDTNQNRCMLMTPHSSGVEKAVDLARFATPSLRIRPIVETYQNALNSGKLDTSGTSTIVGVDDIPTRWAVQQSVNHPILVGATTHWSAMSSIHFPNGPCARCLHPRDDGNRFEVAPTISFVSFSAGLWTLGLLMRALSRAVNTAEQIFMTPTAFSSAGAIWRSPVVEHELCPYHGRSLEI